MLKGAGSREGVERGEGGRGVQLGFTRHLQLRLLFTLRFKTRRFGCSYAAELGGLCLWVVLGEPSVITNLTPKQGL